MISQMSLIHLLCGERFSACVASEDLAVDPLVDVEVDEGGGWGVEGAHSAPGLQAHLGIHHAHALVLLQMSSSTKIRIILLSNNFT